VLLNNFQKLIYEQGNISYAKYHGIFKAYKTTSKRRHINPCTSFPNGKVLPSDEHRPTTLEMRVRNVRNSLRITPRNITFISGIPEPEMHNVFIKNI